MGAGRGSLLGPLYAFQARQDRATPYPRGMGDCRGPNAWWDGTAVHTVVCSINAAGNGFGGSFNLCTTRCQDDSHVVSHPQRITSRAFRAAP